MTKNTAKKTLKKAGKTYQVVKGKAEKLVNSAKHTLENAKDKSAEVLHNAEIKAVDLQDDILNYVKENPIKTLSVTALTAFVAGFVTRIKK